MPPQLVLRCSSSLMYLDEVNPSHLYIVPLCLCWSVSLCLPGVLTVFKEVDSLWCAPGGRCCQCSIDASCQTWELRVQRFGVARLHRHVAIKKPVLVSLERGQAGQVITALWPPSSQRGHSEVKWIWSQSSLQASHHHHRPQWKQSRIFNECTFSVL